MEDSSIIDLYWQRSEEAITQSAQKYGRYCKSIANNILHNDQDAEECCSDAYLGAWNAIPPERPSKLSVFLGKITRNLALNKFDYNTAKKRNSSFTTLLSELEDCLSAKENVESEFEQGETAKQISNFLRTLEEEQRNIFLQRYWYASPIADIAARYNMSQSKIKSLLFRVRNRLKEYLAKEGIML